MRKMRRRAVCSWLATAGLLLHMLASPAGAATATISYSGWNIVSYWQPLVQPYVSAVPPM